MFTVSVSVIATFILKGDKDEPVIRSISLFRRIDHRSSIPDLITCSKSQEQEAADFVKRNNEVLRKLDAQIVFRLGGIEAYNL